MKKISAVALCVCLLGVAALPGCRRRDKKIRVQQTDEDMPTLASVIQMGDPKAAALEAAGGKPLGYFKSKLISIGGGFNVFDNQNQQVAEVKGNWKGWDFKFVSKQGREIGSVTKKWAGLGKELFTSADNYIISLKDLSGASPVASALLLAAGLAIDIVYKEAD